MCVVHAFCAHVRTARLMISMDWLVQLVSCFWLMCQADLVGVSAAISACAKGAKWVHALSALQIHAANVSWLARAWPSAPTCHVSDFFLYINPFASQFILLCHFAVFSALAQPDFSWSSWPYSLKLFETSLHQGIWPIILHKVLDVDYVSFSAPYLTWGEGSHIQRCHCCLRAEHSLAYCVGASFAFDEANDACGKCG